MCCSAHTFADQGGRVCGPFAQHLFVRGIVLQCDAVCCSALQCVAVRTPLPTREVVCVGRLRSTCSCAAAAGVPRKRMTCQDISAATHQHRYRFRVDQNLNLKLYRKIPRNLSFSISWISKSAFSVETVICLRISRPYCYRVAKTHRMPCLYRSISTKEPYNYLLFCEK